MRDGTHAEGHALPGWFLPKLRAEVVSRNFGLTHAEKTDECGRGISYDYKDVVAYPVPKLVVEDQLWRCESIEDYMTMKCEFTPSMLVYVKKKDVLPPLGATCPGAVEPMEVNHLRALVGAPGIRYVMKKPGYTPMRPRGGSCPTISVYREAPEGVPPEYTAAAPAAAPAAPPAAESSPAKNIRRLVTSP
jgi:hypothetical protein